MPVKSLRQTQLEASENLSKSELWDAYEITIRLDFIKGGVPKNKNMIRNWLGAKYIKSVETPEEQKALEDMVDTTASQIGFSQEELEDEESKKWTVFKRVDNALIIEARQLKALFREAANVLKNRLERTALRSRVAERVFIHGTKDPHIIKLYKNGEVVTEPDEEEEKSIHVTTPMGPRNSLKCVEVVYDCEVTFLLSLLRDKGKNAVSIEEVAEILEYAQTNGLGSERSQGAGQFRVVSITPSEPRPLPTKNDLLAQFLGK